MKRLAALLIFAVLPVLSQQVITQTSVQSVCADLHKLGSDWYLQDDVLITQAASHPAVDDATKRAALLKSKADLAEQFAPQLATLIERADAARQALLAQVASQTEEDKTAAQLFAKIKAGKDLHPGQVIRAADYLKSLSERVGVQ